MNKWMYLKDIACQWVLRTMEKKKARKRERESGVGWGLQFKGESSGKASPKRWHLIKELKVRTTHGDRAFQVEEQPMQRPRGRLGVGCP